MQDFSESERADLVSAGVTVPTGIAVKGSRWIFNMGDRDRLVDLLAAEWFTGKVHLLPADVSLATGDLAARLCRSVARTAVRRAITLADDWSAYSDALTAAASKVEPMCDRPTVAETITRPTAAQVIHASMNPQGYARWSMTTEHSGSTLLRNMGLPASRPDVWSKSKRKHLARRDPVAYTGESRFVLPAPMRYGRNGLQPAGEMACGLVWSVTAAGDVTLTADRWATSELLTSLMRKRTARQSAVIEQRDDLGKLIGRQTTFVTVATPDDGSRHGFRGLRSITWAAAPRSARKRTAARRAARAAREGSTNARGRAVGPWSIADRSLPRAITARNLGDTVDAIERAIRAAADHSVVTFADGTTVTTSGPGEVLTADRAYAIRSYARRAALAGVTVA